MICILHFRDYSLIVGDHQLGAELVPAPYCRTCPFITAFERLLSGFDDRMSDLLIELSLRALLPSPFLSRDFMNTLIEG